MAYMLYPFVPQAFSCLWFLWMPQSGFVDARVLGRLLDSGNYFVSIRMRRDCIQLFRVDFHPFRYKDSNSALFVTDAPEDSKVDRRIMKFSICFCVMTIAIFGVVPSN